MGQTWSQMFPPAASFTEQNLPSQQGKVFLITGGTSGVGFELASILYGAGGNVYITARSDDKGKAAVAAIKGNVAATSAAGKMEYLLLEYDDLTRVRASAEAFLKKEKELHVLWNNAGVSLPPHGSKSKQGADLIMSTNCLGPLLFTRLVLPALEAASASATPGSVRIVWTCSQVVELASPTGGFKMEEIRTPHAHRDPNYRNSKLGNWFLAHELAKELTPRGVLTLVQNPGNLNSPLLKKLDWYLLPTKMLLYPPKMGAYTELYAGLSPELEMEDGGAYIMPWGRRHPGQRSDLLLCLKGRDEGGSGLSKEFCDWCEEQISAY